MAAVVVKRSFIEFSMCNDEATRSDLSHELWIFEIAHIWAKSFVYSDPPDSDVVAKAMMAL